MIIENEKGQRLTQHSEPVQFIDHSFGFVRVAAAVPEIRVGDVKYNLEQHLQLIEQAKRQHVQVLVFPELSLTGYTCGDLFFSRQLLDDARWALQMICANVKDMLVVVGAPLDMCDRLYNCACVVDRGCVNFAVAKSYLPNNGEFYEKRWFRSALDIKKEQVADDRTQRPLSDNKYIGITNGISIVRDMCFHIGSAIIGIEICEDLWSPLPPSTFLAMQGANIIVNLSASNELVGKDRYRRELICQQSARTHSVYVYASAGIGESTQDMVFGGACYIAENGKLLAANERFNKGNQLLVHDVDIEKCLAERMRNSNFETALQVFDKEANFENYYSCYRTWLDLEKDQLIYEVNPSPFIPAEKDRVEACHEILDIQAVGLARRWEHTHAQKLVVGVSGGLDSTLALLVAVRAADKLQFDRNRIIGITLPGFGTTDRTYNNAVGLMKALKIDQREISIADSVRQHFRDIGQDENKHDVTYENAQARERTQILMDIANKENGLVVGTGDLSELALGWATYNGDHMSMYGVNAGVPKTLVRYLVDEVAREMLQHEKDKKAAEILRDVLDTPVSPELLPADKEGKIAQKTEDLVGPYELHDFFLYYFVRYGFTKDKIRFLARNAFRDKYSNETIDKWLTTFFRRFFNQQFKRSCLPDGPKVGSVNLSPRGDWRMPSDAFCFMNES